MSYSPRGHKVGHDWSDLACTHIWILSLPAWEERVCLLGFCLLGSILCRFTQAAGNPGCWVPGSLSGLLHCNPHGGSLWRLLLASSVLADIGTIIGNFSACHKQAWRVAGTGRQGCVHSNQAEMRLMSWSKSRLMSVFFISKTNWLIFKAAFHCRHSSVLVSLSLF